MNLSKNSSKIEADNSTDQPENSPMVTVSQKTTKGTVAKSSTVLDFTENRPKRQATGQMFDDFAHEHRSTLKGTAYEGQDKQFHRMEPVISALNPQYEALARYQAQHGLGQMPGQPMDRPGTYWPYRTMVGTADVQGAPQQQGAQMAGNGEVMMSSSPSGSAGEPPLMEPPASAQNFFVPEKCDFGTDPQWCGDYVQQYVKWFEQYGSRGKPMCLSLMDSLKNSDHRCCNALQTLNC
ncbi:hypothetical protein niasHS_006066 [Heterodera schachtii]|uniref:Uncharacterized protein n=1 Tax=Heterodera schachtii TaxID=97005 RepID=A0ABD2JVU9_HETSC